MMIMTTSRLDFEGFLKKLYDNNDNLPSNTCLPLPPTAQVGKIPRERWVWGARCLPLPPTAHVGSTPYMGWAHLHGGQSPFSLEYQTQTCPHPIWYSSNWNGWPYQMHSFLVSSVRIFWNGCRELSDKERVHELKVNCHCIIASWHQCRDGYFFLSLIPGLSDGCHWVFF